VHAAVYGCPLGLSDEQLAATVHGSADDRSWSERQALLIRLVDELHETGTLSDDLWSAVSKCWRPDQLVELLALVGQYHAVSFFINALRIELERFAPRFPPASRPEPSHSPAAGA
jgi:4-carboxymuconolactone decarboxylase